MCDQRSGRHCPGIDDGAQRRSLLAALVLLLVMIHHGLFGRTEDGGVQWSHVVVYLCGAIVFALQADRLFHRLK